MSPESLEMGLDSAVSEQSVGEHVRKHFISTPGLCLVLITSRGICRVQKDRQAVLDWVYFYCRETGFTCMTAFQ